MTDTHFGQFCCFMRFMGPSNCVIMQFGAPSSTSTKKYRIFHNCCFSWKNEIKLIFFEVDGGFHGQMSMQDVCSWIDLNNYAKKIKFLLILTLGWLLWLLKYKSAWNRIFLVYIFLWRLPGWHIPIAISMQYIVNNPLIEKYHLQWPQGCQNFENASRTHE